MTSELFENYLKSGLYLRGWSPKTAVIYKRAFTSFQRSLRETEKIGGIKPPPGVVPAPGQFTKTQLEAWIMQRREAGMSPCGINIYIRAMNAFSAWLKEEGHAEQIVLKQLPAPIKPVTVFSDADLRAILSFRPTKLWEQRTSALIHTLLDTGCRIDEILSLTIDRIDFENLLLTVTGKGSKTRKVPFSLELRKVMFRYKATTEKRLGKLTYLFCTRDRVKLRHRNVYRDIILFCTRQGVTKRVHPHLTRHTFACHFMKNGGSIYTLSRILGHSSVSTTQIYIRGLGVEDFKEEHARLSPLSRLR